MNEFSVYQFFTGGGTEAVTRFVSAEHAVAVAQQLCSSVGAKLGTTERVIITDGGDCTNFEWEFGKGITFPKQT